MRFADGEVPGKRAIEKFRLNDEALAILKRCALESGRPGASQYPWAAVGEGQHRSPLPTAQK